jgi:hypothetical protein
MTSPEGATEALGNSAAVANRHGLGVRRGVEAAIDRGEFPL